MTEEHVTLCGPTIVHPVALSTSMALAMARADIHDAVSADTDHRRTQFAFSARDNAATALLEPASTDLERSYAGYYFAEADAIITQSG